MAMAEKQILIRPITFPRALTTGRGLLDALAVRNAAPLRTCTTIAIGGDGAAMVDRHTFVSRRVVDRFCFRARRKPNSMATGGSGDDVGWRRRRATLTFAWSHEK